MTARLEIPPLLSGGLVLGYRCSSRCRHCLYACGPQRQDGEGELEAVVDLLAERAPRAVFHIGGGEPFLDVDRLERAVAGLTARGLRLDYVETNAWWVRSAAHAEATLRRLGEAGLGCLLVSLSPFHAEHVPLERTLTLIRAAERTLARAAFVWIPSFLDDLEGEPTDRGIDLDALIATRGDRWAVALGDRYGLVAAGRAGRFLWHHGRRRDWRDVATEAPCRWRLADTSHFHVDLAGAYVPGLCAGLVLPLAEVPGRVDLARYPILAALIRGGPGELVTTARERDGFEPLETYSSACDLCTHVRCFLYGRGAYPELGPAGFYDPGSIPDFAC